MIILGIESSCDDTSLAIVNDKKEIIYHKTLSQKTKYGGVVPEVASRMHLENMQALISEIARDHSETLKQIDAIAITQGPGLMGSLMVGIVCAKFLALVLDKPIVAVNHLAAHALTIRMSTEIPYPFLTLLVSGGNTQMLIVENEQKFLKLGETLDDALGEAFDKVARYLNLGYPGGPAIEKRALEGDETRFEFATPMVQFDNCDFSFSGLKTDIKRKLENLGGVGSLKEEDINDICASFQKTIITILKKKISIAIKRFEKYMINIPKVFQKNNFILRGEGPECTKGYMRTRDPDKMKDGFLKYEGYKFVLCGGVSANKYITNSLRDYLKTLSVEFYCSELKLCGDNAAMIAYTGIELFKKGKTDTLDFAPKANFPLY